jgi:hypothetical protein
VIACAKWLGRDADTCTRGNEGCVCKKEQKAFAMFYAERIGGPGEPYIAERGVFMSLAEFAPYRAKGWEGTKETNAAVDAFIAKQTASS